MKHVQTQTHSQGNMCFFKCPGLRWSEAVHPLGSLYLPKSEISSVQSLRQQALQTQCQKKNLSNELNCQWFLQHENRTWGVCASRFPGWQLNGQENPKAALIIHSHQTVLLGCMLIRHLYSHLGSPVSMVLMRRVMVEEIGWAFRKRTTTA